MTNNQIDLFSPAINNKQNALDSMQQFDFPRAKSELETAGEIDPYLADVNMLLRVVEFLLNLGISGKTRAEGLAGAWTEIPKARTELSVAARTILEKLICQRLVETTPDDFTDFVDPAQTLHIGLCYLVLKQPDEAYNKLLDYLSAHPDESHARLWGYFGDACYLLHRRDECNSGYLRALFMNPQAVDRSRLQHTELNRLFKKLRDRFDEETACALWPVQSWLENILHIPPGNTWLTRFFLRSKKFDDSREPRLTPAQRYYQFALCLYIDQSGQQGEIDYNTREKMLALDEALFRQYLERVGKPQKQWMVIKKRGF